MAGLGRRAGPGRRHQPRDRRADRGGDRGRGARGGRGRRRQRDHATAGGARWRRSARASRRRSADLTSCAGGCAACGCRVACDVRNPLLRADGAARVFAPQKGATPEQVEELEQRLRDWARLARRTTGRDPAGQPMAGAAGGLAGGLWAFAGAAAAAGRRTRAGHGRLRRAHARRRSRSSPARAGSTSRRSPARRVFEVATRCRQTGVPCYVVAGAGRARRLRQAAAEHRGGGRGPRLTARRRPPTSSRPPAASRGGCDREPLLEALGRAPTTRLVRSAPGLDVALADASAIFPSRDMVRHRSRAPSLDLDAAPLGSRCRQLKDEQRPCRRASIRRSGDLDPAELARTLAGQKVRQPTADSPR